MNEIDFDTAFKALTGNPPFPWQRALYEKHFTKGDIPASCNLPTGLGKTSVIAVWLIALANGAPVPRRLVYVVNRRTVVDQTTNEVERYRDNSAALDLPDKLAISTLRGQFADNREWSADPARPAVICGTVDMIGSRLLFSGYGCGFKTRPLHAGFLGQDALVVHDEAHLEPAFQQLLLAIEKEQERCKDHCPLKVIELTATSRAGGEAFTLTDADKQNETVQKRIKATKTIHLHANTDEKKLADEIAAKAKDCGERFPGSAVIAFVRTVNDVDAVAKKLPAVSFEKLTGTLRGLERDGLVRKPIFQRFLPASNRDKDVTPAEGTVYLVCTSAGEVGVNISADHLVCDLSTFESMAQRFGRVNRFGANSGTEIHIIHPKEADFDGKNDFDLRRQRTLALLGELNGDGSPAALGDLDPQARQDAFSPQPTILPTSDILFDAWALTTVRDLPGRPPVEPYLHGVEDEKKRETQVAWRAEVSLFKRAGVTDKKIGELLDEFPLRPHELLRDATYRVQEHLAELAKEHGDRPVWAIDPDDTVRVLKLEDLAEKNNKGYVVNLSARTVVLPPQAGGLTETGTLDGNAKHDAQLRYDVGGWFLPPSRVPLVRLLVSVSEGERKYALAPNAPVLNLPADFSFAPAEDQSERDLLRQVFAKQSPEHFSAMRATYRIDLNDSEDEPTDGPVAYLVLKPEAPRKKSPHPAAWPALVGHREGVQARAESICSRLNLSPERAYIATAASLAALWHDLGKDRVVWQRGAGNARDAVPVAKTLHGRPPENLNHFRHELASLVDVNFDPTYSTTFVEETDDCRELLLHLIATHHGRGRPHFPAKEADDPERPDAAARSLVAATPQRFARLQRKYGRWGLAYLESLLRAADALDSKRIEETPIGPRAPGQWRIAHPDFAVSAPAALPAPSISVTVDPTNPGQFFACCGLLELADRLWPGAEGWFADGQFHVTCEGTLANLLTQFAQIQITSSLSEAQLKRLGTLLSVSERTLDAAALEEKALLKAMWKYERLHVPAPFDVWIDWWRDEQGERTDLKTWAAKQMVAGMAKGMLKAIKAAWSVEANLDELFYLAEVESLPFNIDSDLSGQGAARDTGFSADTLGWSSEYRPLLELLAFIGLQRVRPLVTNDDKFRFSVWSTPLALPAVSAAGAGVVVSDGQQLYEFSLFSRTKYMKAFLPATPLRGAQ